MLPLLATGKAWFTAVANIDNLGNIYLFKVTIQTLEKGVKYVQN